MSSNPLFRPWGDLSWALAQSSARCWKFYGCVATEDRSTAGLLSLHNMGLLSNVEMLRITDSEPVDSVLEKEKIEEMIRACSSAGCPFVPTEVKLEAPLQNANWKQRFVFPEKTSFCLDISSLPKRFFFQAIKAALASPNVQDFLILYSKPISYPGGALSENPREWETITGFGCEDPDRQSDAASRLIVGAGFAVDGLHDHLEGSSGEIGVEVLIPFPAQPWGSVCRSWESARKIEEALGADPDNGLSNAMVKPSYHRVGALDTSTAFDKLLNITQNGSIPATFAPLGPKPHSVAMCLLASQTDCHPVYYAQPRTYVLNYSSGFETTYAYWIKHKGINLYSVDEAK